MLRYKVFNWGSFVIYYRNITGESIWTEDHILTMAFKFGPENLAKITCTEYCHDSVGIRPKALLIDIAYQCTWHTSDHKFGHVRWYNTLSFKSILSKEFKQQRRQDERYVESHQSWLSFVSSFAPPPSPPWQSSKMKNIFPDSHQKPDQIKSPP